MSKNRNLNSLPLGKKMTIAIDIDGTVADCSNVDFCKADKDPVELMKAKPIKEAIESVKSLYKQGHKIVFHSSRKHSSIGITKKWLRLHGFPFHYIEMDKFVAHVYIDDRAISGTNWGRVMKEIKDPNLPGRLARKNKQV